VQEKVSESEGIEQCDPVFEGINDMYGIASLRPVLPEDFLPGKGGDVKVLCVALPRQFVQSRIPVGSSTAKINSFGTSRSHPS
jgi:hypothetical protein